MTYWTAPNVALNVFGLLSTSYCYYLSGYPGLVGSNPSRLRQMTLQSISIPTQSSYGATFPYSICLQVIATKFSLTEVKFDDGLHWILV